jgi:hypothetical protein
MSITEWELELKLFSELKDHWSLCRLEREVQTYGFKRWVGASRLERGQTSVPRTSRGNEGLAYQHPGRNEGKACFDDPIRRGTHQAG